MTSTTTLQVAPFSRSPSRSSDRYSQHQLRSAQSHQRYDAEYDRPHGRSGECSPCHHYHDRGERDGRNPLMTVWRETYEVWDVVLEGVGKAWFKMGGK